jgi:hypothetical protein
MRSAADATSGAPMLASTSAWRALADDGLLRAGSARPLAPTAEIHAAPDVLRASIARADAPSAAWLALLGLGTLAFLGGALRLAWAARDVASLRGERVAIAGATVGAALVALVFMSAGPF